MERGAPLTSTPAVHPAPLGPRASLVVLPWLVRLRWVSVVALAGGVAAGMWQWGVRVPRKLAKYPVPR